MGKEGDCGCGGKVKVHNVPGPRYSSVGERPSLVSSLLRASEVLGGDTSSMANSELVDALCDAIIIAREEKQALAFALDECSKNLKELEDEIDKAIAEDVGDDFEEEDEDENEGEV